MISRAMGLLVSVRSKTSSAKRLSLSQWMLAAESWFLLILAVVSLRLIPYARIKRFVEETGPQRVASHEPDFIRLFNLVSSSVDIAARNHLVTYTCLRRAMVI